MSPHPGPPQRLPLTFNLPPLLATTHTFHTSTFNMQSSLATMFKPHWAPVTGLVFAAAQGLAVGGLSAVFVSWWEKLGRGGVRVLGSKRRCAALHSAARCTLLGQR